jgi:hypothetical protein
MSEHLDVFLDSIATKEWDAEVETRILEYSKHPDSFASVVEAINRKIASYNHDTITDAVLPHKTIIGILLEVLNRNNIGLRGLTLASLRIYFSTEKRTISEIVTAKIPHILSLFSQLLDTTGDLLTTPITNCIRALTRTNRTKLFESLEESEAYKYKTYTAYLILDTILQSSQIQIPQQFYQFAIDGLLAENDYVRGRTITWLKSCPKLIHTLMLSESKEWQRREACRVAVTHRIENEIASDRLQIPVEKVIQILVEILPLGTTEAVHMLKMLFAEQKVEQFVESVVTTCYQVHKSSDSSAQAEIDTCVQAIWQNYPDQVMKTFEKLQTKSDAFFDFVSFTLTCMDLLPAWYFPLALYILEYGNERSVLTLLSVIQQSTRQFQGILLAMIPLLLKTMDNDYVCMTLRPLIATFPLVFQSYLRMIFDATSDEMLKIVIAIHAISREEKTMFCTQLFVSFQDVKEKCALTDQTIEIFHDIMTFVDTETCKEGLLHIRDFSVKEILSGRVCHWLLPTLGAYTLSTFPNDQVDNFISVLIERRGLPELEAIQLLIKGKETKHAIQEWIQEILFQFICDEQITPEAINTFVAEFRLDLEPFVPTILSYPLARDINCFTTICILSEAYPDLMQGRQITYFEWMLQQSWCDDMEEHYIIQTILALCKITKTTPELLVVKNSNVLVHFLALHGHLELPLEIEKECGAALNRMKRNGLPVDVTDEKIVRWMAFGKIDVKQNLYKNNRYKDVQCV